MTTRINRSDLPWVATIAVSFIVGLAFSWERWGNPLVDCGREMNQPLRLARGEMLYSDVRHIYGPLSPYLNSALYRLFGPSLDVLYLSGISTAIVIIALTYWLARQFMNRTPAAAATLSVLWLCAFKQAGNYFMPYSYSALHACALGLASLVLTVRFVQTTGPSVVARRKPLPSDQSTTDGKVELYPSLIAAGRRTAANSLPDRYYLIAAGFMAGLTVLAKTEMGLAAIIAGALAAMLAGYGHLRRQAALCAMFLSPAVAIVVAVYGYIVARAGWNALARESFVFFGNLPEELVYYNLRMSGFDQTLPSLALILDSALRMTLLALLIGGASLLLALLKKRRTERGRSSQRLEAARKTITDAGLVRISPLRWALIISIALPVLIFLAPYLQWDKGPYLTMPILLVALLIGAAVPCVKSREMNRETIVLIVVIVYALASLARVLLRVRSGGAYSSYLIPVSVILFTYWWVHSFAGIFRNEHARRYARNIAIGLILFDVAMTAGVLSHRYRKNNSHPITSARGTLITRPDLGLAFNEAINFINREIPPGSPVAVMPEGTSLNFFTDRPNPLREEITIPGFLDREGEERTIQQLIRSNTRLVLLTNRATPEFGPAAFGRDYSQRLMQWIEENYEQVAVFGPDHNPDLQIGAGVFFIRAYMKRDK
ncbi:MAG: hypothetical protein L0229_00355 [Blastocatellia bacterium]|nr:hypothetical protein [Blastocatellia bacterium]